MRVLVTRPAEQAATWVQALRARGADAVALPLIDIAPPHDAAAVRQAWQTLPAQRLVVFVSPSAAGRFFAAQPAGAAWPAGVVAASVGPGTSDMLLQCGLPAQALVEPPRDAQHFDSEALWEQLRRRDWTGAPALVVRGEGGRDWLADTLRAHGADVRFVSAYRRLAPRLDGERGRLVDAARADPAGHLWFFSSGEAIDNLCRACPDAGWQAARALATHPRIAQRARDRGFGGVHEAAPGLDAVWACIQSLAS